MEWTTGMDYWNGGLATFLEIMQLGYIFNHAHHSIINILTIKLNYIGFTGLTVNGIVLTMLSVHGVSHLLTGNINLQM